MPSSLSIVILLFDGITPLDAIGPFDVLGKVPGAQVQCVAKQPGEVDRVIPVARIPKTTSGKVQRAKLLQAYFDGEFDDVLNALHSADEAVEETDEDPMIAELEIICREFAKDRKIGPDDNLFEVGISSLTLTEIVLAIDEK